MDFEEPTIIDKINKESKNKEKQTCSVLSINVRLCIPGSLYAVWYIESLLMKKVSVPYQYLYTVQSIPNP